jgi:hypothetical protein
LKRRWQKQTTLRDSSARRQANVLPLVTFLGRARKVTRLPAGTGEVKVSTFVDVELFASHRQPV